MERLKRAWFWLFAMSLLLLTVLPVLAEGVDIPTGG